MGHTGYRLGVIGALLTLLATPAWSQRDNSMDFEHVIGGPAAPALQPYPARDGTTLHYREYGDGEPEQVIVLLHGSGYHSAYLQPLAAGLAEHGGVRVYTPDLRGHGPAPARRGDVDYIGQLEDDLDDFLGRVQQAHPRASLLLAGHSSGGGLAIRYAGGDPKVSVDGYILLAPYIHHSAPTSAESNADWASPKVPRLILLGLLNGVGITGLNHLTVIAFTMPEAVRNGTETLAYSYRLQTSMHPRDDYGADLAALTTPTLVLAGSADSSFNSDAYAPLFHEHTDQAEVKVLDGVGHLEIIKRPETRQAIQAWLDTPRQNTP
ncbi:alpha/beta hydrolase [Alloalcanivorax gelatiniphagus]|nr:alpha/beta fold hydrolase [Alloalcanivorax gelatiniphagus]|tara:strand:- start:11101 stop:12066 length:966 start_codon:yes stop_codon:yes gene_type:complete